MATDTADAALSWTDDRTAAELLARDPMALLIGMYGHGRKIYAAVKFFMYTMIASVFMLAAILWLYAKVGTFDFVTIQNAIRS